MELPTINKENVVQFKVFLIRAKATFDILKSVNGLPAQGSPQLRLMELNESAFIECQKPDPDFGIINKYVADIIEMERLFTGLPAFEPGGMTPASRLQHYELPDLLFIAYKLWTEFPGANADDVVPDNTHLEKSVIQLVKDVITNEGYIFKGSRAFSDISPHKTKFIFYFGGLTLPFNKSFDFELNMGLFAIDTNYHLERLKKEVERIIKSVEKT